jgi:4-diphosphocytidyl-2-C-methyl-D-erythritol kinase
MQAFDLSDTVIAETNGGAGIRMTCEGADLPTDSTNLAYRAAECALARLGRRQGLRLIVRKRLPVAAGVGGGSSDAAATIRALAILLETGWSRADMAAVGGEIGSDVPFFFYGPTALVEGRGELVSPLYVEGERWLLLVNPGIAIPTAWAYGKLAAARANRSAPAARLPRFESNPVTGQPPVVKWPDLLPLIGNDFAPVMEAEYPVLGEIRLLLGARGADAAMLAGSGSTVFGVFADERSARSAAEGLDRRSGWRTWVTRTQGQPVAAPRG